MPFFAYAILFILIFTFLGSGLTLLLCPEEMRRYTLFLAPVIGFCYLTIVGWYGFVLDLAGTDAYARYALIPPLLFLGANGLRPRTRWGEWREVINSEALLVWGTCFGVFLLFSWPYVAGIQGLHLNSISIGNYDLPDSTLVATYLKEFNRYSTVGFIGQTKFLWDYAGSNIFGGPLATAFTASLLNLQTYQLQGMSIQVFLFFSMLMGYVLARETFGYPRVVSVMLTILFAFNPLIVYTVYHGFQGHIISLPLVLGLVFVNVLIVRMPMDLRNFISLTAMLAVLNWGIAFTYPHMLMLTYVPITIYVLAVSWYEKSWRHAWFWVAMTVAAFALISIGSLHFWYLAVVRLVNRGRDVAGWFIPFLSPDVVFGLFKTELHLPYFRPSHPAWMRVAVSMPLVALIFLGIIKNWPTKRRTALLSTIFVVYLFGGYVALSYLGRTDEGWGGYKSYKFISYYLPLLLMSAFSYFDRSMESFKRIAWFSVTMILLLIPNVRYSYKIMKMAGEGHLMVTPQIVELKRLESNDQIRSINVLHENQWEAMWEANFLIRKKLYFNKDFCYGREASPLEGEWDMIRGEETQRFKQDPAAIYLNDQYAFIRHSSVRSSGERE